MTAYPAAIEQAARLEGFIADAGEAVSILGDAIEVGTPPIDDFHPDWGAGLWL